jgi:hypothetical protein
MEGLDKIRIGIIDDSITQNVIKMRNNRIKEKDYIYEYIELKYNLNDFVNKIVELKLDGLVVDQKLNGTIAGIQYTGTQLMEELNKKIEIPYVFWTSNEEFTLGHCKSDEVESIYNHSGADTGLGRNSRMIKNLHEKIKKKKDETEELEKRFNVLIEKQCKSGEDLDSNELLELEEIDKKFKFNFFLFLL